MSRVDLHASKEWLNSFSTAQRGGALVGPLVALIVAFAIPSLDPERIQANYMLAITILTATWWISAVVPLPIASLVPLILAPICGIIPGTRVAMLYLNWVIFLFIGAFLVGMAIEKTDLHRRIALLFLTNIGSNPYMLLFAFMSVAWLVSMFSSNTATTAMLVPFATGMLDSSKKRKQVNKAAHVDDAHDEEQQSVKTTNASVSTGEPMLENKSNNLVELEAEAAKGDKIQENYGKGVLIGIAYGATCGGIATIIGTAPNSVLVSQIQLRFGQTVTFGQWVSFAFPIALSLLFVAWPVLCFFYVPRGKGAKYLNLDKETFVKSRKVMGPVTRDQWVVATVQLIMVFLWVTRPFFITPLTSFCVLPDAPTILQAQIRGFEFENKNVVNVANKTECQEQAGGNWVAFVDDATIACVMALVLFLVPLHAALKPKLRSEEEEEDEQNEKNKKQQPRILDANDVAKLPWGLFLLFGAGFVISEGFEVSGLSQVLGNALAGLAETPPFIAAISISLFVCFVTEVTSNTATTNIMIAVLSPVAVRTGIHPYLLLVPSTVASSLAFMLPVATPPNSVVYATGRIAFTDMIRPGFVLNILGTTVAVCWFFATGFTIFDIDLDVLPEWVCSRSNCEVINNTAVFT